MYLLDFLRTFLAVLVWPRHRVVTAPRRALIYIATANVGDVICATPLLSAIKKQYPECEVLVVGRGKAGVILKDHPDVDRYYAEGKSITETATLIRTLSVDVGVMPLWGFPELAALILGGVPSIAAFNSPLNQGGDVSRMYRWLTPFVYSVPFVPGSYVLTQYLSLLGVMSIQSADAHPSLGYTAEDQVSVRNMLTASGWHEGDVTLMIAPGSGNAYRVWPAERFAALADYAADRHNAWIMLTGFGKDQDYVDVIMRTMRHSDRVLNVMNQPIPEMKATMPLVTAVLANDSAPIQFARAFDVPVIVFAGPTDEREHHFRDATNRILVSPSRGNFQTGAARWTGVDDTVAKEQMAGITLDMAERELSDLLSGILHRV